MTVRTLRIPVFVAAAWCAAAHAADDAMSLRLERRLDESIATRVEGRPTFASGDTITGRADREVTIQGNAEVRRAGTVIRGDRITYHVPDDELVAVGNVRVVRQGNVFTGPELRLKIDASEGFFRSPSYSLPAYRGSGHAERIEFLGPERVRLFDATYTTCRPDRPDWYLQTDTLTLDEGKGEATGRGAGLYFKDRRLLGTPWFAFPLGDERRSGVLAPTFSYTSRTGPELVAPYYWNIAPNLDFTAYPRLMARRGLQLGGQLRYLQPRHVGEVRFEYTPNDALADANRYFWSVNENFVNVAGGWTGAVNARGVSDDNYFVDYSRSILASSERVLPRDAYAVRSFGDWNVIVRATRYQSILDARAAPPYERVPQVSATQLQHDLLGGFDSETLVEATRFRHPFEASPQGLRFVAYPRISYPVLRPGWFVVPRLGVHVSSYRLENDPAGFDTSRNRVVPIMSIDSGLVFERAARFFGRNVTQTLEPRLFYVRVPYRDQSGIPVFDAAVADFNFSQLFAENTFVGHDRIADLNQLTAAVVSRLIEPSTGAETLRVALGQRFYFSDQRVSIPGVAPRTDRRSDILVAGSAAIGDGHSVDGGLQYSVDRSSLPRLNLLWRYLPHDGRILNAGVRYLRHELAQFDTSWRWPLAPRWTALGRINYSWLRERTDPATQALVPAKPGVIEAVAGFEYNDDCWATRFVIQRFVTAEGRSTTGFFIQLELSGLARLGSDPFDILRRNIPGYRLPSERPATPSRFFGYE